MNFFLLFHTNSTLVFVFDGSMFSCHRRLLFLPDARKPIKGNPVVIVLPDHSLVEQEVQGPLDAVLPPSQPLFHVVDRHAPLAVLGEGHDLYVVVVELGRDAHDHLRVPDLHYPKAPPEGAQFLHGDRNVPLVVAVFLSRGIAAAVAIAARVPLVERLADLRQGHDPAVPGPRRETNLRDLDGELVVKIPDAHPQGLGPESLLGDQGIDAERRAHLQELLPKGRIVLDVRLVFLGKVGKLDLELLDRVDGALHRQCVHLVGLFLQPLVHGRFRRRCRRRRGSTCCCCWCSSPGRCPCPSSRPGVGPGSGDADSSSSVGHWFVFRCGLLSR
mmetsp:Transcript_50212/g.103339  ORF Transcript_50212/g.103339 Transcript_50212/m.103339 type:complete len:330 (-) Transcript_50212:54-1043(-)